MYTESSEEECNQSDQIRYKCQWNTGNILHGVQEYTTISRKIRANTYYNVGGNNKNCISPGQKVVERNDV